MAVLEDTVNLPLCGLFLLLLSLLALPLYLLVMAYTVVQFFLHVTELFRMSVLLSCCLPFINLTFAILQRCAMCLSDV